MATRGILLINLGSPDSPAEADVRRYLAEFLMDPRVLDLPWPLRWFIVYRRILPTRPRESAAAYRSIWTEAGSPLIVTSRRVRQLLEAEVGVPVELGMRYQNPSAATALRRLHERGVRHALLIPLFPHYALSSYETAVEHTLRACQRLGLDMELTVQPPFYEHPDYVEALVSAARPYLEGPWDHLLFSYHGVPERHLRKSDPTRRHCLRSRDCCDRPSPAHTRCYRHQCLRTMAAFVQRAGIPPERCSVAFQSRLGKDVWIGPYTDQELERLAREGVRRLRVICPAFVTDCLETLEEIGLRGRETFLEAGGEDFRLIPCLNDHPAWIRALAGMARRFLDGAIEGKKC